MPLVEKIEFRNFKALRNTTLRLSQFTLLMGANGSGKSTVIQALRGVKSLQELNPESILSVDPIDPKATQVCLHWGNPFQLIQTTASWQTNPRQFRRLSKFADGRDVPANVATAIDSNLNSFRFFFLDAGVIGRQAIVQPNADLEDTGKNLPAVLDRLQDEEPERYRELNAEVCRWLPEYDSISLQTPAQGQKSLSLRTCQGRYKIPAENLSQGTMLSLAMLTLAYLPNPPVFITLEEPDRGLHPRLLRDLRDALYRLAYPESCGESRAAVQVLVTSHSPYFLDHFRDHPDEIVLAEKKPLEVQFRRLSDFPDFEEMIGDAPLSEVWYSGILGGVPVGP